MPTLCVSWPQLIDRLADPEREWHATIQFTQWLQYHLHCQLLRVSQHAQEKRVALKGDLPIGKPRPAAAWRAEVCAAHCALVGHCAGAVLVAEVHLAITPVDESIQNCCPATHWPVLVVWQPLCALWWG
jgi:hypothetical protein